MAITTRRAETNRTVANGWQRKRLVTRHLANQARIVDRGASEKEAILA